MKILIIGGCGFIGYNLLKKISQYNYEITVFDAKITNKLDNVKYVQGNIENIEDFKEMFDNVDIVYHLISTTIPNNDRHKIEFDIMTNLIPTIKILNICVDKNVKKIIFTSSGGCIYGDINKKHSENSMPKPYCAYAINKLAIENYLTSFLKFENLDYAVLRIFNPYGPNHCNKKQGIINVLLDKLANKETVEIWGDGSIERDYIYIDDVINALICSMKHTKHKVFNISSGKAVSINKLLDIIEKISHSKIDVKYLPKRKFDIKKNVLNNSLAKKELGWKPSVSIIEGITILLKG